MNPVNVALRDALLATLRDAPLPMSTNELAEAAPWLPQTTEHQEWHHGGLFGEGPPSHIRDLVCDGVTETYQMRRQGSSVYPHLRALEAKGLIVRSRFAGAYAAYWQAAPAALTVDVADLERMWT